MSNSVSVLNGKSVAGPLTVSDAGLTGMITLRGDLSDANLAKGVKSVTGLSVPAALRANTGKKGSVAWMSPDELILLGDYASADANVAKLDKALKGTHFMAVNVSDARAHFVIKGQNPARLLAKGSPTNINALTINDFRRTRLGQLPVAFWLSDDETLNIICFRSVGEFMFDWLVNAAKNV